MFVPKPTVKRYSDILSKYTYSITKSIPSISVNRYGADEG